MKKEIRIASDPIGLGVAPVSNIVCKSGLVEGLDYEVDEGGGRIIPLRKIEKKHSFEFDYIVPRQSQTEKMTWKDDPILKSIIDKAKLEGRLATNLENKYKD